MILGGIYVKRIFLIDDEAGNRECFNEALESTDVSTFVHSFKSVRDLEIYLDRNTSVIPDVLFLGISTPMITGFKFLESFRKIERFNDAPFVIMYSSSMKQEDKEYGFDLGADAFITKPNSFGGTVRVIRKVLESEWPSKREDRIPEVISS